MTGDVSPVLSLEAAVAFVLGMFDDFAGFALRLSTFLLAAVLLVMTGEVPVAAECVSARCTIVYSKSYLTTTPLCS